MNEKRELIKGSICGVKVQEIENPLMKNIRQLDKIIDECDQLTAIMHKTVITSKKRRRGRN